MITRVISLAERPGALLVASFLALALGLAAGAQAAGARETRAAPTSESGLIPVWAYLDGAYPVADGQVVVMAGGRPVRQLSSRASGRTNAYGVALVSVRRVPRRFTVVVRGGRAAGRRLGGTLRSLAGSDPDAGVVEVNPLTTLVTQLRRQDPQLGFGRASRAVKRYFGVPWWADLGQDLRDGPDWFSVPAYVRDASRYGSIDRLTRAMARRILRGQSGFRRVWQTTGLRSAILAGGSSSATQLARAAAIGGLDPSAGQLVAGVFKLLGSTAAGIGAQGVVGGALGALLELAKGVGLELPKSELEQVQEQLNALGAQVTELQGQVSKLDERLANSDASKLIHHSDGVIADIKTASAQLQAVVRDTNTPEQRANLAAVVTKYIGKHLLKAPETLDLHLNPEVALGDNAIKATSRALAASSRFFDARQSNEVRAVYDYFATYEAELGVLLTNYWNAHPTTYSLDYKQTEIAKLGASVTKAQQKSLKPTVPAGTFLDTKTPRFMWGTDNQTVNALTVVRQDLQEKRTQTVGGFHNYQMPSFNDLRKLVVGAQGNPRAWLQAQVRVPLSHQLVWAHGSVTDITRVGAGGVHRTLEVRIFDLATGKEEQHGYGNSPFVHVTQCVNHPSCVGLNNLTRPASSFLASKSGGLLLLRYLAPGESYWW